MNKSRLSVYVGTFLFVVVGIVATVLGIVLSGGGSGDGPPITITIQSFDFSLSMNSTQILAYNIDPEDSVVSITVIEGNEFISIDANEKVTPIATGKAKVSIKAIFEGVSADKVITITVTEVVDEQTPEDEEVVEEPENEEPENQEPENEEQQDEDNEEGELPEEDPDEENDNDGEENIGDSEDDGLEEGEEEVDIQSLLEEYFTSFYFNEEMLVLPIDTSIKINIAELSAISSNESVVRIEINFSSISIIVTGSGKTDVIFSYRQFVFCVFIEVV